MMSNPETNLTRRIRGTILAAYPDAWIMKTAGGIYQSAGVPDLLVSVKGLLFGLEVKCQRPGETAEHARGRATKQQEHQLQQLRRSGAVAAVVLDGREALSVIDRAVGRRYRQRKIQGMARPA